MSQNLKVVELNQVIHLDWCSIFNDYSFYELHKKDASLYFVLLNSAIDSAPGGEGEIIGVCHFTEVENGVYRSPHRGTFSGFELRDNNIEHLIYFIKEVEDLLRLRNARQIIIIAPPFQHDHSFATQLFNTVFNVGYGIHNQEINYGVTVDSTELIEKMHRNNKKRLRKCLRDGFEFKQVFALEDFRRAHEIITINRTGKGYSISMTFEEIMEMKHAFDASVYFFMITHNNVDVASSICIRINASVLYVFYWGDVPGYEQHSPISLMADGLYRFAQENNFKLMDGGTSTIKGVPNFGLMKFKENLGFTESLKLSYIKSL